MTIDDISSAITSYLLGISAVAINAVMDASIVGLLGGLLLVVRLCFEFLRLVRYIKKGETTED